DHVAHGVPRLGVGRDGRHDHARAMPREQLGDEADAQDVGVAILTREAEALAEVGADDIAVQVIHQDAAPLQLGADDLRDGALASTGEPGKPEGEARVVVPQSDQVLSLYRMTLCSVSISVNAALDLP